MSIKAELSAPTKPTEKEVTNFISTVEQKAHEQKEYKKLLQMKEQLQRQQENILSIQQIDKILNPIVLTTKNITGKDMNLCFCCYEQIKNKTNWCKICGNVVCKNCLTRIRQLQNQQIVKYCDICDKKFLQALVIRQYRKQKKLYARAFQTLISEQQSLQNLLSIQKLKLFKVQATGPKKQVFQKLSRIQKLEQQKKQLKEENLQMKSKINWGKSISSSLKKKQRQLRKLQQKSFGSSSSINEQQIQSYIPKAEQLLDLDMQNINQSFVESNKDHSQGIDEQWLSNDRRTCETCSLI